MTVAGRLKDSYRENEERHAFLLRLSDALRSAPNPGEMPDLACRMLGEHLHVNRVYYADIEGDELIPRGSWAKDVPPYVRRGPVADFGKLRVDALRRGETVHSSDVATDPRFSDEEVEIFRTLETRSFVSVGLTKSGEWLGTFGAHSRTPRVWTNTEIELIQEVAERAWSTAERARAEEALRASEHKFRLSLQAAQLGTWQYNLDTGVFVPDAAAKVMHGFNPDDVIDSLKKASRCVHSGDMTGIRLRFEQAVAKRSRYEHEYRVEFPNGETRWIASLGMVQPGTSSFFGIVQDITARKQAELELQDRRREQEYTLRLLLETAAQGILSVDARGLIVIANAATEAMFGWEPGELIGRSVEQLLPAEFRDRHARNGAAYFNAPQTGPMGIGLELEGKRKDGSTFPIEISLNHVATTDGGHFIAFVTDISARKQAEDALRLSHAVLKERTAELERRTLQLSRLASQLTLAEQHAREQLARTLHDGLQQLLFSARITLDRAVKGNSQTDLAELLQTVRANLNEAIEAARTLSVDLFPPLLQISGLPTAMVWLANRIQEQYRVVVTVTADPRANPEANDIRILLFEAVRELLFNAVKHSGSDRVDINLALGPGDTINIDVSDEGFGFDPDVTLHHRNQQQVGLGLFSIRERFALLGGHLNIQSAPGKGARFSLILPRTDLPRQATRSSEEPDQDHCSGQWLMHDLAGGTSKPVRILIADDHVVVRAGLRELFSEWPALQVVGEAVNGVQAISQARNLQPDIIVMDVSMPLMDGIEATRQIHTALPHIRIVGLSTYDDEDIERSMRQAGAIAYFNKNESSDRLVDHLLDHLLSTREKAKGSL
jgi:PAS domain S-box-containing protein